MPKYSINRLWILRHFDWIFANRSKLKTRPCANFIVTGFVINSFACPYYAYKIDKISLGDLIDLWDKGFIYKGATNPFTDITTFINYRSFCIMIFFIV